jgi:hypothetical protein
LYFEVSTYNFCDLEYHPIYVILIIAFFVCCILFRILGLLGLASYLKTWDTRAGDAHHASRGIMRPLLWTSTPAANKDRKVAAKS